MQIKVVHQPGPGVGGFNEAKGVALGPVQVKSRSVEGPAVFTKPNLVLLDNLALFC